MASLNVVPDPEEYTVETGPDGTVMMFEAEAIRFVEITLAGAQGRIPPRTLKHNDKVTLTVHGRVVENRFPEDKYGGIGRRSVIEVLEIELVE